MSARINLPKTGKDNGKLTGAYGLDFPDGTSVTGKPGGSVVVDDYHAGMINSSTNGKLGLLSSTLAVAISTRRGMRCEPCRRTWNVWSKTCPRCGLETVPE